MDNFRTTAQNMQDKPGIFGTANKYGSYKTTTKKQQNPQ
jgi:hypothetical protein